jgi:uncharacterized membrane protein
MKHSRDWFGRTMAVLVFLAGIGLLLLVFYWSFRLFQVPPNQLFQSTHSGGKPDLQSILSGLMVSLRGILLLALMAVVGGMIANRGVQLYLTVRTGEAQPAANPTQKPEKSGAGSRE